MTAEQTQPSSKPSTAGPVAESMKRPFLTALGILVALAVLGVIAYYARTGAVSDRIRNPDVIGAPAR